MQSDLKEPLLPTTQSKHPKIDPEGFRTPRWLGYVFQLTFVLQVCFQEILSKIAYQRNPDMAVPQLLFFIGIGSSLTFIILMGRDLKVYLSVERGYILSIFLRIALSMMLLGCVYTSVKYLPLIYIALSVNLNPIITVILSYLLLKKGLGLMDTAVLLISFGGVVVIILGTYDTTTQSTSNSDVSLVLPFIAMLLLPFVISASSILQRQMRKLSGYTLGSYLCFGMVAFFCPIAILTGKGLAIVQEFQWVDWGLVIVLGVNNAYMNITRIKASQHEEPAKLASVMYFQCVFQLLFDVLLFHTVFSGLSMIGIGIVLSIVTVRWIIGIRKQFFASSKI
ncbi:hypothetical protein FGO68_gene5292 [Halteria grandinella]|uniref:EamA domain-containing protein n=1 Tax=Halteria grandinella TaxID=5974 RepID=A0A8J8SZX3_HALGN|nr:hypothetical protein FGO68_gene5292 [Halteria grandinella]